VFLEKLCGLTLRTGWNSRGGQGSFDHWAERGKGKFASRDGIHLKDAGYRHFNKLIALQIASGITNVGVK
jgi:hypothetical protein